MDTWAVASNKGFSRIGASGAPSLGLPYGANVVLPKLLLTEAIKGVLRARPRSGVTDRETVERQLEGLLNEDYEGLAWTVFKTGQELVAHARETLTKPLTNYIPAPANP